MLRIAAFYIEGCLFGLDSSFIHDILPLPAMVRIPQQTSQYFGGVVKLEDKRIIHMVNLEKLLGLTNGAASDNSRLIVLRSDGPGMGITADSVPRLLDVDETAVMGTLPLSSIKKEFLRGIVTDNEKVIVLLDAQAIIGTLAAQP